MLAARREGWKSVDAIGGRFCCHWVPDGEEEKAVGFGKESKDGSGSVASPTSTSEGLEGEVEVENIENGGVEQPKSETWKDRMQ